MERKIGDPDRLSARERAILERLSQGLSDQEIAADLFLSANTIRWYNRQLYRKLGVSSRTQAVAYARAAGLLNADPRPTPPITLTSDPPPPAGRRKVVPRLRFTHSFDGSRIAFSISGNGPPLVKAANFISHVQHDWESPVWVHWLQELTHDHTLIYADERASGLSQWDVEEVSFEAWVRDLEAVVDTLGLQTFPLFAMSQAGPVAIAYAVRHPERVSKLILYGAYARGWLKRDLTAEQVEEERLIISLMRVGWGRDNPAFRQVFAMQLLPEATPQQLRDLENHMRLSVSPENAVRLESEMHRIDVRHLAPFVQAPTLILHSREDQGVPFDEGCLLAALIPNAEFVPLESKNHLLTEGEPAWPNFQSALRAFLGSDLG